MDSTNYQQLPPIAAEICLDVPKYNLQLMMRVLADNVNHCSNHYVYDVPTAEHGVFKLTASQAIIVVLNSGAVFKCFNQKEQFCNARKESCEIGFKNETSKANKTPSVESALYCNTHRRPTSRLNEFEELNQFSQCMAETVVGLEAEEERARLSQLLILSKTIKEKEIHNETTLPVHNIQEVTKTSLSVDSLELVKFEDTRHLEGLDKTLVDCTCTGSSNNSITAGKVVADKMKEEAGSVCLKNKKNSNSRKVMKSDRSKIADTKCNLNLIQKLNNRNTKQKYRKMRRGKSVLRQGCKKKKTKEINKKEDPIESSYLDSCLPPIVDIVNGKEYVLDDCFTIQRRIDVSGRNKRAYLCKLCPKVYAMRRDMLPHIRDHVGSKPFKCSECGSMYSDERHLENHMKTHFDVRPYLCSICGKQFRGEPALKVHIRRHEGDKRHKCPYCERGFVVSSSRDEHVKSEHTKETPFLCDLCGQGFITNYRLRLHHKQKHAGENGGRTCKKCEVKPCDCNKSSETRKRPGGKRKFPVPPEAEQKNHRWWCKLCGDRKFITVKHLSRHLKMEHNSSYPCFHCDRCFPSKSARREHLVEHEDLKKYQCGICGKRFFGPAHLEAHHLVHTKEKPHKCTICGKGFTQKWTLDGHVQLHQGRKFYECVNCHSIREVEFKLGSRPRDGGPSNVGGKLLPYPCLACGSANMKLVRRTKTIQELLQNSKCVQQGNKQEISQSVVQGDLSKLNNVNLLTLSNEDRNLLGPETGLIANSFPYSIAIVSHRDQTLHTFPHENSE